MRQANIFLSLFVQLVLVLGIVAMLFGFAVSAVDEEGFTEEVYAHDAAMLAEAMMSRDQARLSLYHLYEDNSYELTLNEQAATIRTMGGEGIGRSARILYRQEADLQEHQARGQTMEWLWFDNQLRVRALSVASSSCPALQTAREWNHPAAIGSYHGRAQQIIETAYDEQLTGSVRLYPINYPRSHDFYLHLRQGDELVIQAGQGDYNARLRCLAERAFPNARITTTRNPVDGLEVTAPDPEDIQGELTALLREVIE